MYEGEDRTGQPADAVRGGGGRRVAAGEESDGKDRARDQSGHGAGNVELEAVTALEVLEPAEGGEEHDGLAFTSRGLPTVCLQRD